MPPRVGLTRRPDLVLLNSTQRPKSGALPPEVRWAALTCRRAALRVPGMWACARDLGALKGAGLELANHAKPPAR